MFCALVLKRRKPRTLGSNHLSIDCIKTANPYLCSIPSVRRPYHNLGCTLAGFTSFHSNSFLLDFVTVALFRKCQPYPKT